MCIDAKNKTKSCSFNPRIPYGGPVGAAVFPVLARCLLVFLTAARLFAGPPQEQVLNLGSRLELFVDHFLIDRLVGGAELRMHAPVRAPGTSPQPSGYYATVIKDGSLYRGYHREYKASLRGEIYSGNPYEVTVYWESPDGIHWNRPSLGLFDVDGTSKNNVILADLPPFSHNFTPFLDTRLGVPGQERFKAVAGIKTSGLWAFVSGDGIRWQKRGERPILPPSESTQYDSQNLAFWSPSEGLYVCYFRTYKRIGRERYRWISRTTSPNFAEWTAPIELDFGAAPPEHLYTSGMHPYFRAPHVYIGMATRFQPQRGNSTDIVLLSSRGGETVQRTFLEAFIRPGLEKERWGDRANYVALNVVPTGPAEMSIYLRDLRYVLRTDGFASIHAGAAQGEIITKRFRFEGKQLVANFSTSAAGFVQMEIQTPDGSPLAGYKLEDCGEIVGDEIDRVVSWGGRTDLTGLAGRAIRLRVVLCDADLYSVQFK